MTVKLRSCFPDMTRTEYNRKEDGDLWQKKSFFHTGGNLFSKFNFLVCTTPYNSVVYMTYMFHCISATMAFLSDDKLKILPIDGPVNAISSSREGSKEFN